MVLGHVLLHPMCLDDIVCTSSTCNGRYSCRCTHHGESGGGDGGRGGGMTGRGTPVATPLLSAPLSNTDLDLSGKCKYIGGWGLWGPALIGLVVFDFNFLSIFNTMASHFSLISSCIAACSCLSLSTFWWGLGAPRCCPQFLLFYQTCEIAQ